VVDGSKAGAHHKLSAGWSVYFDGHYWDTSESSGGIGPNTLHFDLYNSTTGNYFGEVSASGRSMYNDIYHSLYSLENFKKLEEGSKIIY